MPVSSSPPQFGSVTSRPLSALSGGDSQQPLRASGISLEESSLSDNRGLSVTEPSGSNWDDWRQISMGSATGGEAAPIPHPLCRCPCRLKSYLNIISYAVILAPYLLILVLARTDHGWFVLGTVCSFIGMVVVPILVFYLSVRRTGERSPRDFWVRSFDRVFIGLPFALFTLWEISHSLNWTIRFSAFKGQTFHLAKALLCLSALSSTAHIALGALEIDGRICNAVHRRVETSIVYSVQHFLFRYAEAVSRLTTLIIFTITMNVILQPLYKLDKDHHFDYDIWGVAISMGAVLVCYIVWFFNAVIIVSTGRCVEGMPKDKVLPSAVVAYASLAANPFYFLNQSPYTLAGRRATWMLMISWYLQLLTAVSIGYLAIKTWPRLAFKIYPAEFPTDLQKDAWYFLTWQLIISTFVYHLLSILRREDHEARVQLLPYQTGGMAEVQTSAEAGLCQFLLARCGAGVLTSALPLRPVEVNEIAVEKLLGIGSFGLVVRARLERRDGLMLQSSDQELFALKLQTVEPPKDMQWNAAYATQHRRAALGERTVYQRIWQERDGNTGRVGHPFIVRLVCASNWPEGKQLCYAGTDDAVVFHEISSFHYALLMEYLPLGSLGAFVQTSMRRGRDNDANMASSGALLRRQESSAGSSASGGGSGALQWLRMSRRFAAEILLALDFLHNKQCVVHRDLKTDNVLLAKQESSSSLHVKLSDFGFSKIIASSGTPVLPHSRTASRTGTPQRSPWQSGASAPFSESGLSVAGTPYYTAPEMMQMMRGGEHFPTDWSLDVFSFGMLLFALFYGADSYVRVDCEPEGSYKWVRNTESQISLTDIPEDHIKWICADGAMHPHPFMAQSSWEHDLQRLQSQPQCPQHAIDLIRDCTLRDPKQRPTVSQLRYSELFAQQGDIPAIDWVSLSLLDL